MSPFNISSLKKYFPTGTLSFSGCGGNCFTITVFGLVVKALLSACRVRPKKDGSLATLYLIMFNEMAECAQVQPDMPECLKNELFEMMPEPLVVLAIEYGSW